MATSSSQRATAGCDSVWDRLRNSSLTLEQRVHDPSLQREFSDGFVDLLLQRNAASASVQILGAVLLPVVAAYGVHALLRPLPGKSAPNAGGGRLLLAGLSSVGCCLLLSWVVCTAAQTFHKRDLLKEARHGDDGLPLCRLYRAAFDSEPIRAYNDVVAECRRDLAPKKLHLQQLVRLMDVRGHAILGCWWSAGWLLVVAGGLVAAVVAYSGSSSWQLLLDRSPLLMVGGGACAVFVVLCALDLARQSELIKNACRIHADLPMDTDVRRMAKELERIGNGTFLDPDAPPWQRKRSVQVLFVALVLVLLTAVFFWDGPAIGVREAPADAQSPDPACIKVVARILTFGITVTVLAVVSDVTMLAMVA
jgi:hypothetical protein